MLLQLSSPLDRLETGSIAVAQLLAAISHEPPAIPSSSFSPNETISTSAH